MKTLTRFSLRAALGTAAIAWLLWPSFAGAERMTLRDSIDLSLKQSVLLHAAQEGVRGAEAQKREAFTGFLPKFSTSYSYTRWNRDPYLVFPGIPPLIPSGTLTVGTKDNYNWNVEARQPVFAEARYRRPTMRSLIGADIARLDEAAAVQDLVLEVKVAYFGILKAGRILVVAKQSVERLTAHRDAARDYHEAGIIPRNDLLQAEVELANGQQFLLRAENGVEPRQIEVQHRPQTPPRRPRRNRGHPERPPL